MTTKDSREAASLKIHELYFETKSKLLEVESQKLPGESSLIEKKNNKKNLDCTAETQQQRHMNDGLLSGNT